MKLFVEHYYKETKEEKIIVVFGGRFNPFHLNHYKSYLDLVNSFGKENVYIATSNKVELPDSPFTFEEKKQIIKMYSDIPESHIVQVKVPYKPEEVFKKINNKNFIYVAALGKKDVDRLTSGGKYYQPYKENNKEDYTKHGYVWIINNTETFDNELITGSLVRNIFRCDDKNKKVELFNKMYGSMNNSVFNLINERLNKND